MFLSVAEWAVDQTENDDQGQDLKNEKQSGTH